MQPSVNVKKRTKRKNAGKVSDAIRGQIETLRRSVSSEFLSLIPRGSLILPYGSWKKTRYVTKQTDGIPSPSVPVAIKHTFRWRHNGRKIYLTGSFANNWGEFLEMSPYSSNNADSNEPKQRKTQDIELYLPPGQHQYYFIVDGTRMHDEDFPFKLEENDQPTNVLTLDVHDSDIPASAIVNVAQTMQTEHDAERKKEKFYYQMQAAFMNIGAQMLGLSLMLLLYLNYVMLQVYLTPIFWALMFGIVLRNPKQQIIQYLEPIRQIEKSFYYRKRRHARFSFMSDGTLPDIEIPEFWTLWDLTKAKAKFIITHTIHPFTREHFNIYILLIVLMSGLYGVYFGWWFSNAWLFIVPLVIFLGTIFSLIVLDSSWHDVIIASLLITLGIVTFMCFTHFFAVTTVQESKDMYTRIQMFVENKLNETSPLDSYFQQQNLTQDLVRTYLNSSKTILDDWLTKHNLGTFQVQRLVAAWNSNSTALSTSTGRFPSLSMLQIDPTHMHTDFHQYYEWYQNQDIDFSYVSAVSNLVMGTGLSVLTSVLIMVSTFKDLVLGFTVFLACLYYLLVSKEFFLDRLVEIIPVEDTHKISIALRRSVNGIFLSSLAICGSHALVTFVFFTLCGLEFKFIATFFTAFTAIFPVLSAWLICIPVFLLLYFSGSPYAMMQIVIFLGLRMILLFVSDPYIFTKIPNSHPYITGLSMVSGIYTFGLEGVLIGPMLVILTYTVFDILDQYRSSSYEVQH